MEVNALEKQATDSNKRYRQLLAESEKLKRDIREWYGASMVEKAKPYHDATQALNAAVDAGKPALPLWFDDRLEKVCGEQMVPSFLYASAFMTLCWIMVMVGEIKSCLWWVIFILNAERPQSELQREASQEAGEEGDYDSEGDNEVLTLIERNVSPSRILIVGLTPGLKVVLLIMVPLVRAAIAVLLMFAGIKFVFVQTNMANAVLKVMTLKFVITIDEVLMKALSTMTEDRILKSCKIYSPGARTTCGTGRSVWFAERWDKIGGMFWLLASFSLWIVFYWLVFGGEYSFRRACLGYHQVFPGTFGVKEMYSISGALDTIKF